MKQGVSVEFLIAFMMHVGIVAALTKPLAFTLPGLMIVVGEVVLFLFAYIIGKMDAKK